MKKEEMISLKQKADKAALFLKSRFHRIPSTAFFSGTGLGDAVRFFEIQDTVPYQEIPHFPVSTVQSHEGSLLLARSGDTQFFIFKGRFHLYEGYTPQEVSFPVRVLRELGVGTLILSNASGGLNPHFKEGDIMLIDDHINLTGENPLAGAHEESFGDRFPLMTGAYDRELSDFLFETGRKEGFTLRRGVYAGLKGPSLETPAEMRFLRMAGADAVGFSTVMETISAVQARMKVVGLSTITNLNIPNDLKPTSVEEIIRVAGEAAPCIASLVRAAVNLNA